MKNLMIAVTLLFILTTGCQPFPWFPSAGSENNENSVEARLLCDECNEDSCTAEQYAICSAKKKKKVVTIASFKTVRRGKPGTCFGQLYNCVPKEEFINNFTLKVYTFNPDLAKVTILVGDYFEGKVYATGEVQEYDEYTHIAAVKLTVVNNELTNEFHLLKIESIIRVEDEEPTIFIGELGQQY